MKALKKILRAFMMFMIAQFCIWASMNLDFGFIHAIKNCINATIAGDTDISHMWKIVAKYCWSYLKDKLCVAIVYVCGIILLTNSQHYSWFINLMRYILFLKLLTLFRCNVLFESAEEVSKELVEIEEFIKHIKDSNPLILVNHYSLNYITPYNLTFNNEIMNKSYRDAFVAYFNDG